MTTSGVTQSYKLAYGSWLAIPVFFIWDSGPLSALFLQDVRTTSASVGTSSVAQGALAQAVQEHREWVKFDNMTQEHGPAALRKRVYCPIPIISLPLLLPWVPEPEFALLAQELELGLSGGASWTLQILQVENRATS